MLALFLSAAPFPEAHAESRRNFITDRSAVDGSHYTTSPALAEKLNAIFDGNASIYYDKACTEPVDTYLGTSPVRNNGIPKYVGAKNGGYISRGTSCWIYANGVYYTLFGESTESGEAGENSEMLDLSKTASRRATYENFKAWGVRQGAGALIRASGHSLIVLDYDEESLTYLDGNGDGHGLIAVNKETWDKVFYSYVYYIIQPKEHHYSALYATGACGDDLSWSVDDAGTLTISGTGDILYPAWSDYNDRIKKVVIRGDRIGIGNGAFYNCSNLEEIVFEGEAPSLSESAFLGVTATVRYPATKAGWHGNMLQDNAGNLTWSPYGMTQLEIITQPQVPVARSIGLPEVSIEAVGDGLTYAWYVKNAGEDVYIKSSITGPVFSASAGKEQQVLCVVKDQYGNFLVSQSVLLQAV